MQDSTVSQLINLFKQNNHNKILDICEPLLFNESNDIELLYCSAIAAYICGKTQKGHHYFKKLFNLFENNLPKPEANKTVLLFLGISTLQMIEFAEKFDIKDKHNICKFGIKRAKLIAKITGTNQLEKMAQEFENRLILNSNDLPYLRQTSPTTLQIEMTNHCNLKCTMCPRSHMTRKNGFMDIMLWEKIIKNWAIENDLLKFIHLVFNTEVALNLNRIIVKSFFMGEPLLHPQFDLMIKIAKEAGCVLGVHTNGTLLKDIETRQRLLNSRPSEITISIDGIDEKSYNNVRKGSNFKQIFNSIKALHNERKSMVLSKFIKIYASTILPEITNKNISNTLAFFKPILPYIDALLHMPLTKSYNPTYFNKNGKIRIYEKKIKKNSSQNNQPLCSEPLEKLNILWDGTVTPCCYDINGEMKLGNANNDSIDDIWNSEKVKDLHKALITHNIEDFPLCRQCKGI